MKKEAQETKRKMPTPIKSIHAKSDIDIMSLKRIDDGGDEWLMVNG